jgi:hypothetical protein
MRQIKMFEVESDVAFVNWNYIDPSPTLVDDCRCQCLGRVVDCHYSRFDNSRVRRYTAEPQARDTQH